LQARKRTKVRSLAVFFSVANWDRSPARSDWSKNGREHITQLRGQGAERPHDQESFSNDIPLGISGTFNFICMVDH
ncbi:hypothetical protein PHJA_001081100, partial [Phtheirospermum japonicum]